MKKIRSTLLTICIASAMLFTTLSAFTLTAFADDEVLEALPSVSVTIDTGASVTLNDADGDGYYDIGTADELYAFAAAFNGGKTEINGELISDIVINEGEFDSDGSYAPAGEESPRVWTPIGASARYVGGTKNLFLGNFDGNNKKISGLYVNDKNLDFAGLFGAIGEGCSIRNVGVVDSYIYANGYVGGLVGENEYGTVANCYYKGTVSCYDDTVGGVVGCNDNGTVTRCFNEGRVISYSYAGGVVGYNYCGAVSYCYNVGAVEGSSCRIGGVVGNNFRATLSYCYNLGTVEGTYYVGGVVGDNDESTVTNCYYLTGCAKDGNGTKQFGVGADARGYTSADVEGATSGARAEAFSDGTVYSYLGEGWVQNDVDASPLLCVDAVTHAKKELLLRAKDTSYHETVYSCCGNLVEVEEHTAEPVYTLSATDPTRHYITYSCCGKLDATEAHTGGPVYTLNETDPTQHDITYSCCDGVAKTEMHGDYIYTAAADKITVECGHCEYTAELRVCASNVKYNGESRPASVVGSAVGISPEIVYKQGDDVLEGAPTNAGVYSASISLGEATASVEFTIEKAAPQSNHFYIDYPKDAVYNGEAYVASVDLRQEVVGMGNYTVKIYNEDGQLTSSPVDAGKYFVHVSVEEGDNYTASEKEVRLAWYTVAKATPTYTAPVAVEGLSYSGEPQVAINAGSTEQGEMRYGVIKKDASSESVVYSAELPTVIDAGTYFAYYEILGDKNYEDVTGYVEVVVGKATPTLTVTSPVVSVFPSNNVLLTVTADVDEVNTFAVAEGTNYTADGLIIRISDEVVIGRDTVTVKVTSAETANYLAGEATLVLAVGAAESSGQVEELEQEIEGLEQEIEGFEQEIEELEQEIEGFEQEIEELEQTLSELRELLSGSNDVERVELKTEGLANELAELEEENGVNQTLLVISCVLSGVALCGCGALAVFYFIVNKRKRNQ